MATKIISKYWLNKNQYIAEVHTDNGDVLAIVTIDEDGEIVRMRTFEKVG